MNGLDLCLEGVSRSCQPLCYIRRWIMNISETVRDRGLVPKDHQYEMAYVVSNSHVTDDVTWPQRCCEAVRSAILATAWLLVCNTRYFHTRIVCSRGAGRSTRARPWTHRGFHCQGRGAPQPPFHINSFLRRPSNWPIFQNLIMAESIRGGPG